MELEQVDVTTCVDPDVVASHFVALDAARPEPDVTPLKLQKLLYLAQANYLAATGWRLFDADVEAFDHGPVVYPIYKKYQSFGRSAIAPDCQDANSVPQDVRRFLDQVWDKYKDWSAMRLRNLTHAQLPWVQSYVPGAFRTVIPDALMRDYFRHSVPSGQRFYHPDVTVVDQAFLDRLDEHEDEIVDMLRKALA